MFRKSLESWKSQPGFQYLYYDDNHCKDFLLEHYGRRHFDVFQSISIGAFKSDFFRYCWMYKMGGIYADLDSTCLVTLKTWLAQYPNLDIVLARDDPTNLRAFYQAFIYCRQPGNKLMKQCIDKVMTNVKAYQNGSTIDKFHFTGPGLVYDVFVEQERAYMGRDLPSGLQNTSYGKMLILTWDVPNLILIDDTKKPVVKHKCDNCYDGVYWFDQANNIPWYKVETFTSKVQLNDGVKPVRHLLIMSLFRNNATYLQSGFFPVFEEMERMYDLTFEYLFLENDSTDNTRELLLSFLERRDGALVSPESPLPLNRTERLAHLRNTLAAYARPKRDQWCCLIDSDVFFDTHILVDLFAHQPRAQNIGLLSPFTLELNSKHYYDTFAFVDSDGQTYWPECPFKSCDRCKIQKYDKNATTLLDVKSCFNGFALLDANVLLDHRVEWATEQNICEHIMFCYALRKTGKRVCVATNVDNIYWRP